jgi:peptide/nickel transport system ATP-binding protein
MQEPVVKIDNLQVHFEIDFELGGSSAGGRRIVRAVDGLSAEIRRGEIISLVGESGSGKTTLGRTIVGLIKPTSGSVFVAGLKVDYGKSRSLKELWRKAQMIFQDPYSSFNPLTKVYDSLVIPLHKFGICSGDATTRLRIEDALKQVGLSMTDMEGKYPNQLSGGQRQRLAIARALLVDPQVLVADEPVSMLDVSLRAGVLDLLRDLNEKRGLTIIFITHDLAVAEYISHRIAVMYRGELVELAPARELVESPQHPYTELLLNAVPRLDSALAEAEKVQKKMPGKTQTACKFYPRCPLGEEVCIVKRPKLAATGLDKKGGLAGEHYVACHVRNPASTV